MFNLFFGILVGFIFGVIYKNHKLKELYKEADKQTKQVKSIVCNIPYDLVELIYQQRKMVSMTDVFAFPFLHTRTSEEKVPYTDEEYGLMLRGADLAYNNQHLLGTKLPNNSPKAKEIDDYLVSKGVRIQFHPHHGMQIVDVKYKDDIDMF